MDVPLWIVEEIRYWIDIFNLGHWAVDTILDRVVQDDPDCMGWCERMTSYNHATLHFRDDIEDTPKWRKVILHECLHIVMGRVDAYVQDAVIPGMAESSHDFAGVVYTQLTESFVQMLTDSFWRYYREQMDREHAAREVG